MLDEAFEKLNKRSLKRFTEEKKQQIEEQRNQELQKFLKGADKKNVK